jgi:hypothetical protein
MEFDKIIGTGGLEVSVGYISLESASFPRFLTLKPFLTIRCPHYLSKVHKSLLWGLAANLFTKTFSIFIFQSL